MCARKTRLLGSVTLLAVSRRAPGATQSSNKQQRSPSPPTATTGINNKTTLSPTAPATTHQQSWLLQKRAKTIFLPISALLGGEFPATLPPSLPPSFPSPGRVFFLCFLCLRIQWKKIKQWADGYIAQENWYHCQGHRPTRCLRNGTHRRFLLPRGLPRQGVWKFEQWS